MLFDQYIPGVADLPSGMVLQYDNEKRYVSDLVYAERDVRWSRDVPDDLVTVKVMECTSETTMETKWLQVHPDSFNIPDNNFHVEVYYSPDGVTMTRVYYIKIPEKNIVIMVGYSNLITDDSTQHPAWLATLAYDVESGVFGDPDSCSIDFDCEDGYECVGGVCVLIEEEEPEPECVDGDPDECRTGEWYECVGGEWVGTGEVCGEDEEPDPDPDPDDDEDDDDTDGFMDDTTAATVGFGLVVGGLALAVMANKAKPKKRGKS